MHSFHVLFCNDEIILTLAQFNCKRKRLSILHAIKIVQNFGIPITK